MLTLSGAGQGQNGSSVNPDAFIIQVQTDNTGTSADNQFTLPFSGGTYDIKTPEHNLTNQAGRTILTFSSAGIYNIEIIGNTAPFQISNASYGDRLKVIDIINFGNIPFFDYRYAFRSFTNLTTLTATDSFDFSNVGTTQASLISAFQGCSNFVSGINGWNNFGIINNMSTMFRECRLFNDDITNWDVSNVTRMDLMFYGGNSFNQDIGNWDVSNVTNMNAMFGGFGQDMAFDQDISSWQISQVTNLNLFMNRVTLSTANYDALLIAWDAQGAMSYSGTVDFGNSQYTPGGAAEAARTSLISKWGGIIDGGAVPQPFIIEVNTANAGTSNNDQFTLIFSSASSPTVNYDVDWGDGNVETGITSYTKTHTYANAGVYTVSLTGQSGAFVGVNDLPKITDILQWGTYQWNLAFNFRDATNLSTWSATDSPNLSNATSMLTAFVSVPLTTHDFSDWDVTTINSFANTFFNCDNFQGNGLDTWDCRNATNLSLLTNATGITTANYDALLIAWDALGSYTFSGTANFGNSQYTLGGAAEAARTSLISKWGGIVDGGGVTQPFIIQVKTDNAGTSASNQFTIPTNTSGITQAFNYDIETSDGQTITGVTGNHTITFPSAGTYEVRISGSFPYIYFNNGGDRSKMLDVSNFGIYALGSTSQANAFRGCSNMTITATDSGNFGSVTNFTNAWRGCGSLTSFPLLDTSSVTNFTNAWYGCNSLTSFPLLDTSSGTSFQSAWQSCSSLANYPANAFDTNIATNYTNAFRSTNLTTQSIDDILVSLDTSGVSNGTFFQSGGQAPSATGQTAIDNLVIKGWAITVTT